MSATTAGTGVLAAPTGEAVAGDAGMVCPVTMTCGEVAAAGAAGTAPGPAGEPDTVGAAAGAAAPGCGAGVGVELTVVGCGGTGLP